MLLPWTYLHSRQSPGIKNEVLAGYWWGFNESTGACHFQPLQCRPPHIKVNPIPLYSSHITVVFSVSESPVNQQLKIFHAGKFKWKNLKIISHSLVTIEMIVFPLLFLPNEKQDVWITAITSDTTWSFRFFRFGSPNHFEKRTIDLCGIMGVSN